MPLKNTDQQYGLVAQFFHWAIVALIITQEVLARLFHDLPRGLEKFNLINDHKAFGMTVLILAVARLVWRFFNQQPNMPPAMKTWEITLANMTHWAIYFLIFAIPISGWLMSSAGNYAISYFGLFKFPFLVEANKEMQEFYEEIHELLVICLRVVIALHIAAALKHHFIDKDNVLRRMLPFVSLK